MKNSTTGLEYANTDPSLHYNHSEPHEKADWRRVYIYLLRIRDYDSAELIASRNMASDECSDGDHDDCNFSWCTCSVCHGAVQFALQHPKLRSLAEIESEASEAA